MTATDLRTPEAEPRLLGRPRAAAVLLRAAGRQAGWSFGSRIVTTDVHGRRAPRRARVRDLANWDLQGDGTIVVATSLKGRVALARISPRPTAAKPLGVNALGYGIQVAGGRIAILRRRGVALVDFRGRVEPARVDGVPRPGSFTDFDGRRLAWTQTEVLEPPTSCSRESSGCTPSPGRTRTTVYAAR